MGAWLGRARPPLCSLFFMLWLVSLFLLNGILLDEPVASWIVSRFSAGEHLRQVLKPLFTAAFKQ